MWPGTLTLRPIGWASKPSKWRVLKCCISKVLQTQLAIVSTNAFSLALNAPKRYKYYCVVVVTSSSAESLAGVRRLTGWMVLGWSLAGWVVPAPDTHYLSVWRQVARVPSNPRGYLWPTKTLFINNVWGPTARKRRSGSTLIRGVNYQLCPFTLYLYSSHVSPNPGRPIWRVHPSVTPWGAVLCTAESRSTSSRALAYLCVGHK